MKRERKPDVEYGMGSHSDSSSQSDVPSPQEIASQSAPSSGSDRSVSLLPFSPTYDADGNATLIRTATGTWQIAYNGENRPIRFENAASQTVVECAYDSQGRRFEKKVTVAGTVTLHERYVYDGYLQIAAFDVAEDTSPEGESTGGESAESTLGSQLSLKRVVYWDPEEPTATRPLAIQKDGSWFTYGHDITKNVWEVFGPSGYVRTSYDYAPFGAVSPRGDVTQPFQWSSEFYDSELDLVYYNYRHYSPTDGRWLSRDPIEEEGGLNLYAISENKPIYKWDVLGKSGSCPCEDDCEKKAEEERKICLINAQNLYEKTLESLNHDYEVMTEKIDMLQDECLKKCQMNFEKRSPVQNTCVYICKHFIGRLEDAHYGIYFAAIVNNEISFWGNKRQCENGYYLSLLRCRMMKN
ncbi:MAG: RHS repeat domain-containing protein [Candidatus Spyradosoma sp.]